MYRVAVERDFIARHYLIGGNWGSENNLHSHHYRLVLEFAGPSLDEHNYLLDIDEINKFLDTQITKYSDKTLNDLPEFEGINPSIEIFARVICMALNGWVLSKDVIQISAKLWENETAWASYELER